MSRRTGVALVLLGGLAIALWLWQRGPQAQVPTSAVGAEASMSSRLWLIGAAKDPAAVGPLLKQAIQKAGGAALLDPLASATWTRSYTWPGGELRGELLHDAGRGTLRRGIEPGIEVGRVGSRCWLRRGDVVTGCALEDRALLRIHQAAHDATVLVTLARPPYRPVGVAEARRGRRSGQALVFDLDDGPWRVVVVLDVAGDHAAERVSLHHRKRRLAPIHCDLDDPGPLAGLQVARTRRLRFEERMVLAADGREVPSVEVETMAALRPGVDRAALTPPAATAEGPMSLGSRPPLLVAYADVPEGHGGALAALDRAETLLPPELQLVEPEWFEVIGTGAEPEGVTPRVQVWVASALYTVGAERTPIGRRLTRIEAEPRIARQVIRAPFAALPAHLDAFAGQVRAAGYELARRPRVVRVVGVPGTSGDSPAQQPWLVELQLPLAATPTQAPANP